MVDSVDLVASPDKVWALIGQFGGMWHPLIAKVQLTGKGVGQLRAVETIDGKQIIERLEAMDNSQKLYRYTNYFTHSEHASGQSLITWAIYACASLLWLVYGLLNRKPPIFVGNGISLEMNLLMVNGILMHAGWTY